MHTLAIATNWISFLMGRLMRIPIPRRMRRAVISCYAAAFGANLQEAAESIEDYPSLSAFFVRELKPGLRPIASGAICPVDGKLVDFGRVDPTGEISIKGMEYELDTLFVDRELAQRFYGGDFLSFYLSPKDYHHVHCPVGGAIRTMIHVEGALLPVNNYFFERVRSLFAFNERILTVIDSAEFGLIALIAVGALNVGSISVEYDSYRANSPRRLLRLDKRVHVRHYQGVHLEKGSRLARFELGSSVLVFFQPGAVRLKVESKGEQVKIGDSVAEAAAKE